MRWIIFASAVFSGLAGLSCENSSDWYCNSWDDNIEHDVFQPLRGKLMDFSSDYKNFSGADFGWFGFGINWQGVTSGNYSLFHLNQIPGQSSSRFCNTTNGRFLSARIAYDELSVKFHNLEVYTPFFTLSGYKPTIYVDGVKIFAYVNATVDATSKTCNASLGWFALEGFDSLYLQLENSLSSWVYEKIFNWLVSPRIAAFLKSNVENESISYQVKQFLAPAVQAQNDLFCRLLQ